MSADQLSPAAQALDRASLPRHLAVIMDGNGRWAKARGLSRVRGHEEGAESVRAIVETCRRLEIAYLTLYAFSTENWARPKAEVSALMKLLERFLKKERADLKQKEIRLNAIGDLERLPKSTRRLLGEVMADTRGCGGMVLTLSLSYGGREELIQAARRLAARARAGELEPEAIDEAALAECLYTHDIPDPDLMIRTSGEVRISNFLLWQLAYAELYFTDTPWPAFREAELVEALESFAGRQRRFGQTGEQIEGGPA